MSMETDDPGVELVIAVLTYRRPEDIARILPQLVEQASSVQTELVRASIVVVDNDPTAGAREFVTSYSAGRRGADEHISIRYENEPTPGISAARNRALRSSVGADVLVFIDDDERPSPKWLACLLQTYDEHHSAAVVGPVISEFEREPDAWVRAGRFFDRRRLATGTRLEVAATNNLLLDMQQIRNFGITFDLDFGITGGDDTMFTKEIRKHGGTMIWCDEAVVFDVVPATRLTHRWVVLRALSSGNSWSLTSIKIEEDSTARLLSRVTLTGRGTIRAVGGAARYAVGLITRRTVQEARGLRTMARGAGMVLGAWGYAYKEYRRQAD